MITVVLLAWIFACFILFHVISDKYWGIPPSYCLVIIKLFSYQRFFSDNIAALKHIVNGNYEFSIANELVWWYCRVSLRFIKMLRLDLLLIDWHNTTHLFGNEKKSCFPIRIIFKIVEGWRFFLLREAVYWVEFWSMMTQSVCKLEEKIWKFT